MTLLYEFEFVEVGDDIVAVPVGDKTFNGVLNINESAREYLEAIASSKTPEEAFDKIYSFHPQEDEKELKEDFDSVIKLLIDENILTL